MDIWSQDLTIDTGLEPDPATAGQPMWESQDIWVRNDASNGPHQNPIVGQPNQVHVRVRNRGGVATTTGTLKLYWAVASSGLPWPGSWTLAGTSPLSGLAAGADSDKVISWTPSGTGHYCLLARLETSEDPMTYVETTNVSENTRNNNNIVWKNVAVVPAGSPVQAEFLVRGLAARAGRYRLVFQEVRPEAARGRPLLEVTRLGLMPTDRLKQQVRGVRWLQPGRPIGRRPVLLVKDLAKAEIPLNLRRGESLPVRLTFEALTPTAPGGEPYLLRIIQIDAATGEVVGGMTYEIRSERR